MSFEKQKIQHCFNKAARTYDQAAILQHEVGKELLKKLAFLPTPTKLVDLGAGTGYCTELLHQALPNTHIIGLDFSYNMLAAAKNKIGNKADYLCADFDQLPLAAESIDLIYSNFSLQWSLDLCQTLAAAKAALKKQKYFVFSTLAESSLHELRTSSIAVDNQPHANCFLMQSILQKLVAQHFEIIEFKSEIKILYFDTIFELMHNLKDVGANHVFNKNNERFADKRYFLELEQHYEAYRQNGKLPVTYEIIYGVVRK